MRKHIPNRSFDKAADIMNDDSYGIFPAPMDNDTALEILTDYLLGEDWYVEAPMSPDQFNTIMVYNILIKYSRQFRKDVKDYKKNGNLKTITFDMAAFFEENENI